MFRDSMAEQQANARKGDKTLKTRKKTGAKARPAARKTRKPARERVPA
jgi:hypothetical protein